MLLKNQNSFFTHQVIEKEVNNKCHSHQSQVNFSHLLSQEDYISRPAFWGTKDPLPHKSLLCEGFRSGCPQLKRA